MTTESDTTFADLVALLRTFARRPRNWVVLARNLIPVFGVYGLSWWSGMTLLYYWLDGLVPLAMLLLAVFVRGMAMMMREKKVDLATAIFQGVIGYALFFGLLSIPFTMVYLELNLGAPLNLALESRWLSAGLAAAVLAHLIAAFQRGGYFGCTLEEFRQRANPELQLLVWRGLTLLIFYHWTGGIGLVPLFALFLTACEVWPAMKADLAQENASLAQRVSKKPGHYPT